MKEVVNGHNSKCSIIRNAIGYRGDWTRRFHCLLVFLRLYGRIFFQAGPRQDLPDLFNIPLEKNGMMKNLGMELKS